MAAYAFLVITFISEIIFFYVLQHKKDSGGLKE